jgi:hypothetical protein
MPYPAVGMRPTLSAAVDAGFIDPPQLESTREFAYDCAFVFAISPVLTLSFFPRVGAKNQSNTVVDIYLRAGIKRKVAFPEVL